MRFIWYLHWTQRKAKKESISLYSQSVEGDVRQHISCFVSKPSLGKCSAEESKYRQEGMASAEQDTARSDDRRGP